MAGSDIVTEGLRQSKNPHEETFNGTDSPRTIYLGKPHAILKSVSYTHSEQRY